MAGPYGPIEAECLRDALIRDSVRARMCEHLARRPSVNEESELERLASIAAEIDATGPDADLREAIDVIRAYERAFAWSVLGFERLLWLCREATMPVSDATRANDHVLQKVASALPGVVRELEDALGRTTTSHLGAHPEPLTDVREFLKRAVDTASSVTAMADVLFDRHGDVQRGKFDRGRRKLPWLERTAGGLTLTMTRVGGATGALGSPDDIRPHAYRLAAADALIAAGATS
jgi:hypothetical protein